MPEQQRACLREVCHIAGGRISPWQSWCHPGRRNAHPRINLVSPVTCSLSNSPILLCPSHPIDTGKKLSRLSWGFWGKIADQTLSNPYVLMLALPLPGKCCCEYFSCVPAAKARRQLRSAQAPRESIRSLSKPLLVLLPDWLFHLKLNKNEVRLLMLISSCCFCKLLRPCALLGPEAETFPCCGLGVREEQKAAGHPAQHHFSRNIKI